MVVVITTGYIETVECWKLKFQSIIIIQTSHLSFKIQLRTLLYL